MPASARGPAKSSLPLLTRITSPSTPVLPHLSPRKAARVPHLPQPLVPQLMSADQLRIATAALVNAHQPRSATAILANVPAPPAPTTLLEHLQTSAFAPAHPYPRPSSHRVRAEVACADLEQTMQAHYKDVKPPMMPGANSASAGTPRRLCTAGDGIRNEVRPKSIPRAFPGARPALQANRLPPPGLPADKTSAEAEPQRARPPFMTVSHDEWRPPGQAWRIWRRLSGPAARRPGSARDIVFEGGIWTGLK